MIADQVFKYMKDMNVKIEKYYTEAPKSDKKEYMLWIDENVPRELRGNLRNKYLNKSFHLIKKFNGGYKTAKEIGIKIEN